MQVVPIFQHHCTDGEPLGMYQYDFESTFAELSKNRPLTDPSEIQKIRIETLKKLGLGRMDYRLRILHPPTYLIDSSLDTAFVDRRQKSNIIERPAFRWDN